MQSQLPIALGYLRFLCRDQMEMVQQYTQFEKIGSTLQGVAEEEEEEEVPREDFTVCAIALHAKTQLLYRS